jgi:hypothetical protein
VIYPPGLTHGMQIGLGVLLLLVAIIGYWGFLRRRGPGVARALADGSRPGHRDAHRHQRACSRSLRTERFVHPHPR